MLIHFVQDEFLELELDVPSERRRLAQALALRDVDLESCKVFVSFGREGLTRENCSVNIEAGRGRLQDAASQTSLF